MAAASDGCGGGGGRKATEEGNIRPWFQRLSRKEKKTQKNL
jgi:hypothetical protein